MSLAGCPPLQRSIQIHFTFLNSVQAVWRFEWTFSPADSFSWLPFFLSVWDRPACWQLSIRRCGTLLDVYFYCWCTRRVETNLTLFFFLLFSLPPSQVSSGYLVVAFVYVTEFVGIKARTWASMHVHAFFAMGVMIVALVGFLVRTWWVYQIFLSIATLPFVLCCWMLPETPFWLLSEERYEDAQKVIDTMARWNKISIPCKVSELCSVQQDDLASGRTGDDDTSSAKKHNILDLFCNWQIARRTITVWLIWFTGSLGYYVFSLSSVSLGGNEYLNLFLIGKYFCTLFC